MGGEEGGGVLDDEGEVAAAASAGHLPGEDVGEGAVVVDGALDVGVVLLFVADIDGTDHGGEHGGLGVEGGAVGLGEALEVVGEDGGPAGVGSGGEGFDLGGGDVAAFDDGAAGLAGFHGDHDEVLLEEAEGHLVGGGLDLIGPEGVVVVVPAEAGDADADGVLGAGDMAAFALGVVLEAEDEAGEHLGVHIGELDGPDLLDHLTRGGAEAAAVADVEGGLEGDGDGPAGVVAGDVGLVDPGAGEVETGGDSPSFGDIAGCGVGLLELLLEAGAAAGFEAGVGGALEFDVLDAALGADAAFLVAAALGVDDEDVGLDEVKGGKEVDDSPTLVDIGGLDGLDVLDHEEAFFLGEHGLAVFVLEVGGVGADADVEVAKL